MIYDEGLMRSPERFANSRKWKRARPLIKQAVEVCSSVNHELAPWALHLAGKAAERLSYEAEAAEIFTRQMTENGHTGLPMTALIASCAPDRRSR